VKISQNSFPGAHFSNRPTTQRAAARFVAEFLRQVFDMPRVLESASGLTQIDIDRYAHARQPSAGGWRSVESPHVSQIMAPDQYPPPAGARPLLKPAISARDGAGYAAANLVDSTRDGMLRKNAVGPLPPATDAESLRLMQAKVRVAAPPPDGAYLRSDSGTAATSGRFLGSGKARVDPSKVPAVANLPVASDADIAIFADPSAEISLHREMGHMNVCARPTDSLSESLQGQQRHWVEHAAGAPPPPCAPVVGRTPDPIAHTVNLKEEQLFARKRAGALKPQSTFAFG